MHRRDRPEPVTGCRGPHYNATMTGMAGSDRGRKTWWRDSRAWWPAVVGLVLVASGLVHLVIWCGTGGPWEGPLSWRKPILFGLSGGLTCLSAGWVWSLLPRRRGDTLLAPALAAALFIEVLLIDVQCWRGVASHFNRSTPLDSFLADLMAGLILAASAVLLALTIRLFGTASAAAEMLLAARAGMVFLVISCGLGIWVGAHGDQRMAAGLEPDRFGIAGVPKFPHGVVIHAIQWLPALAWAARRAGLSPPTGRRVVSVATVGTAVMLAYAVVQTLSGGPRFPPLPAGMVVLAAGAACLLLVTAWTTANARASAGRR